MDLVAIRKDVEDFYRETGEEYYRNMAGLKDEMELAKIYERYRHLFTRNTVMSLKSVAVDAKGEDDRRLRFLKAFTLSEFLQNEVKELTDKALTMESTETITVDGEKMAFRLSAVKMSNQENRGKRKLIFDERNHTIGKINGVLVERLGRLHSVSKELGYRDYEQLFSDVKEVDFRKLDGILQGFLARTEKLYLEKMGEYFEKKIGVGLRSGEKHDLAFLFRAKEFDPYFPKEKALALLKGTLKGMGFDLSGQKNIMVDLEERPKKSPRAFMVPVKVPEDIRLVVMPQGGQDDYLALFHESGHAEHYANADGGLEVEYKYLGDYSLTEGFAFLLEHLCFNEAWLKRNIELRELERFLKFSFLSKLYFLRRYSAKLSYEIGLHSKGIDGADSAYRRILERALGLQHPEVHYLMDVDDGFYAANYLRAWIFEAQLSRMLVERFGQEWFSKPEAGRLLSELWSTGQKFTVEEVLARLGYSGLDLRPLEEEIRSRLS